MNTAEKQEITLDGLRKFTGDTERYRHPLNRMVIYTPGVQFLAEQAGAYWLIDVIASYLTPKVLGRHAKEDSRILDLHFWRLDVLDGKGLVTAFVDKGYRPFITQEIQFTDFPLETVDIWAGYDGDHWTLYLPSEH